jgi:hypothetical protein
MDLHKYIQDIRLITDQLSQLIQICLVISGLILASSGGLLSTSIPFMPSVNATRLGPLYGYAQVSGSLCLAGIAFFFQSGLCLVGLRYYLLIQPRKSIPFALLGLLTGCSALVCLLTSGISLAGGLQEIQRLIDYESLNQPSLNYFVQTFNSFTQMIYYLFIPVTLILAIMVVESLFRIWQASHDLRLVPHDPG